MIDAKQIPDEVVEAARAAYREGFEQLDSHEKIMRAAIAAALSAWPNVTTTSWFENGVRKAVLNIPLPQEVSDE